MRSRHVNTGREWCSRMQRLSQKQQLLSNTVRCRKNVSQTSSPINTSTSSQRDRHFLYIINFTNSGSTLCAKLPLPNTNHNQQNYCANWRAVYFPIFANQRGTLNKRALILYFHYCNSQHIGICRWGGRPRRKKSTIWRRCSANQVKT